MSLAISLQNALTVRAAPLRRFEFGECLLDRIAVRRVGRWIAYTCADRLNRLAHAINLVGAQIVREDDIALFQGRRENLLDICNKCWPIHRAIDDRGRGHAIEPQGSNERQRLSVTVWYARDHPLAAQTVAVVTDHFRRDRDHVGSTLYGMLSQHSADRALGRFVRAGLLSEATNEHCAAAFAASAAREEFSRPLQILLAISKVAGSAL